jgi:hypothetical protein
VLVFEVRLDRNDQLIYPTALMGVTILALVGLGLFRWLTDPAAATAELRRAEERVVRGDSPSEPPADAQEEP